MKDDIRTGDELGDLLFNAECHPKTHAIIAAMLGREPNTTSKYMGKAIVTSDGYVQCNFVGDDGMHHHGAFVGSTDELNKAINAVIEDLALFAEEIEEVHQLVDDWIAIDYRQSAYGSGYVKGPR